MSYSESTTEYLSEPLMASNQQNDEEETLVPLIIGCAQSIARDDQHRALSFIKRLEAQASPSGCVSERLAHYFTQALTARISGSSNPGSSNPFESNLVSIHKLYRFFKFAAEVTPVIGLSVFFTNQTILEHSRKFKRLHIVDYGISHGFRWLCFLKDLSLLPGGPPTLRLTGVEAPQHHTSIVVPIEQTAANLIAYAKTVGVPFSFNSVVSDKWELITPSQLGVQSTDNEVLIVTSIYRLRHLNDELCLDDSPRKMLLRRIVEMRPQVFIQAESTLSSNCGAFEFQVREALDYYSGLFGAFAEITPDNRSAEREFLEGIHGKDLMNMLAFEGDHRRERPECHKQWQVLARKSGLKPLKLKKYVYNKAVEMVDSYNGSFSVTESSNWLLVHWKDHLLSAITAWSPIS